MVYPADSPNFGANQVIIGSVIAEEIIVAAAPACVCLAVSLRLSSIFAPAILGIRAPRTVILKSMEP